METEEKMHHDDTNPQPPPPRPFAASPWPPGHPLSRPPSGLILSRRLGEEICIGEGPDLIRVVVVDNRPGHKVRIMVDAPGHIAVDRREIRDRIEWDRQIAERARAGTTTTDVTTDSEGEGP